MRRAEALRVPSAGAALQRGGARTELSARVFLAGAALVFLAAATVTVQQCAAMAAMPGMDMPGGWRMSMAWMRMPGSSWAATGGSFLGMWLAMMTAMMLPSMVPVLRACRARAGGVRPALLAGLAYFSVSSVLGVAIFAGGATLAALAMHRPFLAQAAPLAAGLLVTAAGGVQLSAWKARHLACCRQAGGGGRAAAAPALSPWRCGVRLGVHCSCCCSPHTAVLLVVGVMDLRAMAAVSVVITAERVLRAGPRLARLVGGLTVAAGLVLVAHAAALA
jgi:predicted metal-binding membrane protein